ncbi:MAG: Crp/Fnr family transcriptional regulator [Sphingomicrobium sp.]|nr:Crp/Fnr family transcriptional regulator [Sphingomonadales bacterium]
MSDALLRKLESFAPLFDGDRQVLRVAIDQPVRTVAARRDFAREGDAPRSMHLIVEGWAARHKTLSDGRRQIVGLLVAGDLCDLDLQLVSERDHSLGAINEIKVAEIPFGAIGQAMMDSPRLARALRLDALVVTATSHEWTLNIGQRSAYERIAHLFAEMAYRQRRAGLSSSDRFEWPLTQVDLADATGLTPVHVNRTLQQLRRDGLIVLANKRLVIPDLDRLRQAGLFNSNYLHLEQRVAAAV